MFHAKQFATSALYREEVFSTHEDDNPLLVQFCGNDPEVLVSAVNQLLSIPATRRVDGIDLNLGCPQGIARKGHYGSFLLNEPDLICDILSSLSNNVVSCPPLTVKMRLVSSPGRDPSFHDTIKLINRLDAIGIDMLCLHGRDREMKGQFVGPTSWESCKVVKELFRNRFPIICNGGIESYQDVIDCLEYTQCDGVMSSEAILEQPDLFHTIRKWKDPLDLAWEFVHVFNKKYPSHRRDMFEVKCVKAHLFKILFRYLQQFTHLREQLAITNQIYKQQHKTTDDGEKDESLSSTNECRPLQY